MIDIGWETHDFLRRNREDHSVVGWISDTLGGVECPSMAIWVIPRAALERANTALEAGRVEEASRALDQAEVNYRRCDRMVYAYREGTISGAEIGEGIAIGTAVVCAVVFVVAGGAVIAGAGAGAGGAGGAGAAGAGAAGAGAGGAGAAGAGAGGAGAAGAGAAGTAGAGATTATAAAETAAVANATAAGVETATATATTAAQVGGEGLAATELAAAGTGAAEAGAGVALTSGQAGGVVGWGTGQTAAAVAQTEAVTQTLTTQPIRQMIARGVTREWVVAQLALYEAAVAQGATKLVNNQLLPRLALMRRLLELWP